VCPCASEHLPCCKNCTDGFAIPYEIKKLIESKLKGDDQKLSTTTDSNQETSTAASSEGHEEQNLKLTPAVRPKDETTKNETTQNLTTDVDGNHCETSTAASEGHKEQNLNLTLTPAVRQKDETSTKNETTKNLTTDVGNHHCEKLESERAEEKRGTLRELVDSERDVVSRAFGAGHDNDIIAQAGSSDHKVTRGAMKSLQPGLWVEDEVINSFFYLLSQQDEELCKNDVMRKRNGFFNSFFMTKLLNEGHSTRSGEYEYQNIRNWSSRFVPGEDIFEVDKLFFVINVERQHWVLAVIDVTNQKIQMYDSGRRFDYKSIGKDGFLCLEILFRYLQDEHLDKRKVPLPNAERWQLIPCCSNIPQQSNSEFASAKNLQMSLPVLHACLTFVVIFVLIMRRLRLRRLYLYVW
jgi:hypothetical protein